VSPSIGEPTIDSAIIFEKAINKIKNEIPSEYLKRCEWFEKLSQSDNQIPTKKVLKVHNKNMAKAKECHAIHNRLVDFIQNDL